MPIRHIIYASTRVYLRILRFCRNIKSIFYSLGHPNVFYFQKSRVYAENNGELFGAKSDNSLVCGVFQNTFCKNITISFVFLKLYFSVLVSELFGTIFHYLIGFISTVHFRAILDIVVKYLQIHHLFFLVSFWKKLKHSDSLVNEKTTYAWNRTRKNWQFNI